MPHNHPFNVECPSNCPSGRYAESSDVGHNKVWDPLTKKYVPQPTVHNHDFDPTCHETKIDGTLWGECMIEKTTVKASDKQVAGDHYKKMAIQPLDYALANGMGVLEHGVLKYLSRFTLKGTPKDDLDKMIHYAEMLREDVADHPERYGL